MFPRNPVADVAKRCNLVKLLFCAATLSIYAQRSHCSMAWPQKRQCLGCLKKGIKRKVSYYVEVGGKMWPFYAKVDKVPGADGQRGEVDRAGERGHHLHVEAVQEDQGPVWCEYPREEWGCCVLCTLNSPLYYGIILPGTLLLFLLLCSAFSFISHVQ